MRLAFWKKRKEPKKKKPAWREWLDAGIFALVAATIIRTLFFEAYTIPTGSMEGSLLVNDYMFVSKMAYGARLPMTPLSFPLVHNTMPIIGGKSYSESVKWKYRRLPGFRDIKRNDIVVFNFPNNDTTMLADPAQDYYSAVRQEGRASVWNRSEIITRPVDKRENYVKRCVAIPGDVLEIKDGILFINGKQAPIYPHQRIRYAVKAKGRTYISEELLTDNGKVFRFQANGAAYNVTGQTITIDSGGVVVLDMEYQLAEKIRQINSIESVTVAIEGARGTYRTGAGLVFPHDAAHFPWNTDNYGPITIPKKGTTVTLTPENYALYDRIIRIYENNTVSYTNGNLVINGKTTNQYTFKMNYYWMMGDNRHQSLDSRYWGFVPEDHIVGTPSFVWLSYGDQDDVKKGIRWNRIFRTPKNLEKK